MHALLIIAIAEIQQNGYYISYNSKKGQPGVTRVWKLVNTTDFNTVWILTGTVWILTGHTVFLLLRRDNIQIVAVSIASREYKHTLFSSTYRLSWHRRNKENWRKVSISFIKKGTKTLWRGRSETYVRNPMTVKGKHSIGVLFYETFQPILAVNNSSVLLSGGVERKEDIFSKVLLINLATNSYLRQLYFKCGKICRFLSWIPYSQAW